MAAEELGTSNGENILYMKGRDDVDYDEIWDDEALIRAYDEAVGPTYEALGVNKKTGSALAQNSKPVKQKLSNSQQRRNRRKKEKDVAAEWHVGDMCLAQYSEDGEFYEAVIIDMGSSGDCTVRYTGYENEEQQCLADLQKITDRPESSRCSEIESEAQDHASTSAAFIPVLPPPPPPPPPNIKGSVPDDEDALVSMLMSWYMSGYHTGYYQALRDIRRKK